MPIPKSPAAEFLTMINVDDETHMSTALAMAEAGRFSTHPNPRVGAVVVQGGKVVGQGAHLRAGASHAEIFALAEAGVAATGATLYVTLEPCCHQGRTPPCTDAIIASGVKRVVIGMEDPNPLVSGKGVSALRAAGVAVDGPCLPVAAAALNPGFVSRMARGRPWVRLKQAVSLDGKLALASGESQWLTGKVAQEDVQKERAQASAILAGVGTVLADNPRLAPRMEPAPWRYPVKIVLDSLLRTPADAALLQTPGEVWILHGESVQASHEKSALLRAGARLVAMEQDRYGRGIDLHHLMSVMAAREINEILVEGGGRIATSLIEGGLVDEWLIYVAPLVLGENALPFVSMGPYDSLAEIPRWRLEEVLHLGNDVKLRMYPLAKNR